MRRWQTPLGVFNIKETEHGVCSVDLIDGSAREDIPQVLSIALNDHLLGKTSTLRLDLQGVRPLAQLTLAKLLEVPYGEVRSYAWIAKEIGHPAAVRAVATAVGKNPIPLLIPCHRVVRSDGHIGEYSFGGTSKKKEILQFENVDIELLEELARRKVRFMADKESNLYHLISCKKGPSIQGENTVELRSAQQAIEAHFDPCRRCKPNPPAIVEE